MALSQELILFGYDASPYTAKIQQVLALSGTAYKLVDQPVILPRPDLEALEISFRRIPLLAIGPEIYADSQRCVDEIVAKSSKPLFSADAKAALPGHKLLGDLIFRTAIWIIPTSAISPAFAKDRASVFPVLVSPNFEAVRPHALGEMKALLIEVEENLLDGGRWKWVGGASSPTLADAHVGWSINWSLNSLGLVKEPGLGEKDLPNLYDWLKRYLDATEHGKEKESKISGEEAKKAILAGINNGDVGDEIDSGDALKLSSGAKVEIYPTDAEPTHPQKGSLVLLNAKEVAIKLNNGATLHFPRLGYRIVKDGDKLI